MYKYNMTTNTRIDAKLLYVKGCHAYHQAFDELISALIEAGYAPQFEVVMVETNEEAEENKFFGSPAIQINGVDVDPKAEKVSKYQASSCRPYIWEGESYDYPPKGMILAKLKQ